MQPGHPRRWRGDRGPRSEETGHGHEEKGEADEAHVGAPNTVGLEEFFRVGSRFFPRDEWFMRLALREAEAALEHEDVPIGAVVVHDGELIGAGHNERELRQDPTAHAEVLALRQASRALGSWRLLDTVLYVTLEPCAMCAGAIVLARVPRVVFATADPKAGAVGSVLDILDERRLNHRAAVASGLLAAESAKLLHEFFTSRR